MKLGAQPKAGEPIRRNRRLLLTLSLGLVGWGSLLAWVPACTGNPARGTIGAVLLRKSDGRVYVRDVPPHLAAARAGIRPGDELLLIDGQDVRRLGEDDLHRSLSGLVGEEVNLTLARGDQVLRLTIRRSMAEAYRLQ
jgi:C-terminal processing protease CtpA/Prc